MNWLTNKPMNTETRMSTHLGWANHILTILETFLHPPPKKKELLLSVCVSRR